LWRIAASPPEDVVGIASDLWVAGEEGTIRRWRIKKVEDGKPDIQTLDSIPVQGQATRLSISPDGLFLAATMTVGTLEIFGIEKGRKVASKKIPSEIRDLIWVDPGEKGPLRALWSDQGHKMPETLRE